MNKLFLLILIIISSSSSFCQQPEFKRLTKDSLKNIDRNAEVLILAGKEGHFTIKGIEGNFKTQKNYLKEYILTERDTALMEIQNKKDVDFETYQRCFFTISKIYQDIWNEQAEKLFKKKFKDCKIEEKEKITKMYPIRLF